MQQGCKAKTKAPLRTGQLLCSNQHQPAPVQNTINTMGKCWTLSIQCRDWDSGKTWRGGLLKYLRFSLNTCRHDRSVRNARLACINTFPLLLSYPLTSILRHHFEPYFLWSHLGIFSFYLFANVSAATACRINQRRSMCEWINHSIEDNGKCNAALWQVLVDETQARLGSIWCWGPPPDGGEGPDRHILMWEKKTTSSLPLRQHFNLKGLSPYPPFITPQQCIHFYRNQAKAGRAEHKTHTSVKRRWKFAIFILQLGQKDSGDVHCKLKTISQTLLQLHDSVDEAIGVLMPYIKTILSQWDICWILSH